MSDGVTTYLFKKHNSRLFKDGFSGSTANNFYFFIGKSSPWTDEGSPPEATNSVANVRYNPWVTMTAMKRIKTADTTYVVPRYDWTSGTSYRRYDSADEFGSSNTTPFYVMTADNYNIYKCIDNNNNSASTTKPTGTSTGLTSTADGYTWKYMTTLVSTQINSFLTTNFIPVKTLLADDTTTQWDVQVAAASSNGAIHKIIVSAGGGGYLEVSNTFASVTANGSSFTIQSSASSINNIYNDSVMHITAGTGAGQIRRIIDYIGTTRTVTVNSEFTPVPTTASSFRIAPRVIITSGSNPESSGTKATAVCRVSAGAVANVTMISNGTKYRDAQVRIFANTSHGSGATARAIISPPGGHGLNIEEELYAHNVLLFSSLTGTESSTIPVDNDFRTIGVIKNPLRANTSVTPNVKASADNYDLTTKINFTSLTGTFAQDEIIRNSTKSANAIIVFANSTVLKVYNSNGTFSVSDSITGSVGGATATISTITNSLVAKYTGDVMYVENRAAVLRSSAQTEELKLILKF